MPYSIILCEVLCLGRILYKRLDSEDITLDLFRGFHRHQEVKRCWRKENSIWVLKDIAFTEEWGQEELAYGVTVLKRTIAADGAVFAAMEEGSMIGFASVEKEPFGSMGQYLQLANLHVSFEHRGQGIGKRLFSMACGHARLLGARKLYISAHSSQESQAFYKAVGCVEAQEYNLRLEEKEPCDCQMEYVLT